MTTSTLPIEPPSGPQDPLVTVHVRRPPVDPGNRSNPASGLEQAVARAASTADYAQYTAWLEHTASAGECTRPIRLAGAIHTVEADTGRILATRSTDAMPDGVIYKACGNRRATVCPSCSETYRGDTYQVIRAGLAGGKGVPDTVARHPSVFVTLTAPGFGPVHTRSTAPATARPGRPQPALPTPPRPRPLPARCRPAPATEPTATATRSSGSRCAWTATTTTRRSSGTLSRRTVAPHHDHRQQRSSAPSQTHGATVKLSFGKVAEMQARGVVHFHAIIRLDGVDPLDPARDRTARVHRRPGTTLADAVHRAAAHLRFPPRPHPDRPHGWRIAWGTQLDIRPVRASRGDGTADHRQRRRRLPRQVRHQRPPKPPATSPPPHHRHRRPLRQPRHPHRPPRRRLLAPRTPRRRPRPRRRQALADASPTGGSAAGHTCSASAATSPPSPAATPPPSAHSARPAATGDATSTAHRLTDQLDGETPPSWSATLTFAGTGWHTTGDAVLAATAAAKAREHRRLVKELLAESND